MEIAATTNIPLSDLLNKVVAYKYNPSAIQSVVLDHLSNVTSGQVNLVDPSNPFVFLLESSAVNAAAFMTDNQSNLRKQYPALAQTESDLYYHMSDEDYIGRFSTPAPAKFSFLFNKEDLLNKMITETSTASKKVTIPRNTEFKVNDDITFSLEYPVDIRLMAHGGLQITYDTTIASPLQTLTTNVIGYSLRTDSSGVEWIYFEVETNQFFSSTDYVNISASYQIKHSVTLTDKFYFCRCYWEKSANVWQEMYTTHSDQVYDNAKPTALLSVADSTLTVTIPQIYITTGQIYGRIRIDAYQTRGAVSLIMENYQLSSFSYNLKSIDKTRDTSVYTAALNNISFMAYCAKTVVGGLGAMTFDKLRDSVIKNSVGTKNIPITDVQVEDWIDKKGYQIVKNVDMVTNRIYLATKPLPDPFDNTLVTAASASINTLSISMDKAALYVGVKNNGDRITLTPDLIYLNNNGVISIVPDSEIQSIKLSGPDKLASYVNNNNMLYSPFHYVMDASGDEFELRPYYLDSPSISSLKFVQQNQTTGLQVNTQNYSLLKTSQGYSLKITTKSNDAFKELDDSAVFVQLFFTPPGESARAYLNGTLASVNDENERIYEFNILSNLDITSTDYLCLTNFTMFAGFTQPTYTPLSNTFGIVYSANINPPSGWTVSSVDLSVGNVILDDVVLGVTQEQLDITLGSSLKTLWARSRSVTETPPYQTHTTDKLKVYLDNIYEIDEVTGAGFWVDANGDIQYTLLHAKGDPVLDNDSIQVYEWKKGDIVYDANGQPVVAENFVQRQIDLLLIDAPYYFATDTSSAKYKLDMVLSLVQWLTEDLATLTDYLLDQTRLYFYPKKNTGTIDVIIDNGQVISIESGQSLMLTLYVPPGVYRNEELRDALRLKTIKLLDTYLKNPIISSSQMVTALRAIYADDVVSVRLSGIGGDANLETLKMKNDSDRLSIKKKLVKLPDDKLIVQEDVTIEFIKNDVDY